MNDDQSGKSVENTKTIKQIYVIQAPVSKVWRALTNASMAEQWGAGPARTEIKEGGAFSYWDGDIHGVFTKLVPEKLIVQDWYGHDNPSWKYVMSFELEDNEDRTTIHLTYSGNIVDEQRDIDDLKEYYFDPITKLLESQSYGA
jgi:uncharacterized protein YndB with AHSA1/START domain